MLRLKSFVAKKRESFMSRRASLSSKANKNGNDEDESNDNEEQVFRLAASVGGFSKEGKGHSIEDRYCICDDLMSEHEKTEKASNINASSSASSVSTNDTGASDNHPVSFLAVYDGHGGSECSDFLSRNLHLKVAKNMKISSSNVTQAIYKSFEETENDFIEYATKNGIVSGSCAAMALINGLEVTVAHCGDCRVIAQGDRGPIELTKDHRISRMAEKTRIINAGGKITGNRVMGILSPTRSFGNADIKISSPGVVIAEPEILNYRLELGKDNHAYLIIASDGVWDVLENEKAMQIVVKNYKKTKDPQKAASALVTEAAKYSSDDVTVTVVVWSVVAGTRITSVTKSTHAASDSDDKNLKELNDLIEENIEEESDKEND